jgi:hypothetical protein
MAEHEEGAVSAGYADDAYAVVIPTIGRPGLTTCLRPLAEAGGPRPVRVILVDERPRFAGAPLPAHIPERLRAITTVVSGGAWGPAAARNIGWRLAGRVP